MMAQRMHGSNFMILTMYDRVKCICILGASAKMIGLLYVEFSLTSFPGQRRKKKRKIAELFKKAQPASYISSASTVMKFDLSHVASII
jgi:hypothetical protein